MTTKETYIDDLSTLTLAGVPLIVTQTREPYQAIDAIQDYVHSYNRRLAQKAKEESVQLQDAYSFGKWSPIDGWTLYKPEDFPEDFVLELEDMDMMKKPEPDENREIVTALNMLNGTNLDDADDELPAGIYVMTWPHPAFENPLVKLLLMDIAHKFIAEDKKLILVVPETGEVPAELQDFVCFLDYTVPSESERLSLIDEVLEAYQMEEQFTQEDKLIISSSGAGMTGFEFSNSVSRAIKLLSKKKAEITSDSVGQIVLENKTEMVKRSEVLEIMPKGRMSDIGGLDNLKEWVGKRKRCFTPEAADFGVDAPKGIALGGPPGTGKSASAKAIGHELGLPVVRFDVSKVFGSLVGQSEARVRQSLSLIKAMAPCVAFLDEVDKAFDVNRGGGDSGVGSRVLGSILTFMQEDEAPVFWVMTFNRSEGLPPELLRKGRLDEVFSVSVPNDEERLEIFKIHLRKRKQDPETIENLDVAVAASEGFVAAELEAAVKEAVVECFNSSTPLTGEAIAQQFSYMRKLSDAFKKEFDAMKKWADENARPASKDSKNQSLQTFAKAAKDASIVSKRRKVAEDN